MSRVVYRASFETLFRAELNGSLEFVDPKSFSELTMGEIFIAALEWQKNPQNYAK